MTDGRKKEKRKERKKEGYEKETKYEGMNFGRKEKIRTRKTKS